MIIDSECYRLVINLGQKQPSRGVLKRRSKFIEITTLHRCSPVNLLHIFRTPFLKNTTGRQLLLGQTNVSCHYMGGYYQEFLKYPVEIFIFWTYNLFSKEHFYGYCENVLSLCSGVIQLCVQKQYSYCL